jgi:hypothetical protein
MESTALPINAHLELNLPGHGQFSQQALRPRAQTASVYFAELFPDAAKQYGCPFVEIRDVQIDGSLIVTPVSINVDFFAGALGGDRRLGHSIVYYEPEMQFYYREPHLQLYKTTAAEKLQNFYRGLLQRAAQELPAENNRLNLCIEFRSDRTAKAVVQRAKSILAANSSFFSATSPHQRIKGPELHERLMRKLVETMLEPCQDSILTMTQAYNAFCRLVQQSQLGPMKRSMFKITMRDLVAQQFGLGLRRDVPDSQNKQQEAWKGVRLLECETLAA